jgi:hypothetical protein
MNSEIADTADTRRQLPGMSNQRVGDRCLTQATGKAQGSEPDLHQLPIDMAEGAIAKRTPPEPLAFIGICGIDPGFVRPCHGGQVNEASDDVNHRTHCPPGFDSCIPAISEPHAI